ncbi:MAG: hypothetical protein ACRD1N_11530 [Terriglobia bacterium]
MSAVYIFIATPWEARHVARLIAPRHGKLETGGRLTGIIGPVSVEMFVCGAGPQAAAAAAQRALLGRAVSEKPGMVLVAGLCGALSPRFSEGTLLAYTRCILRPGDEECIPVPLAAPLIAQLIQAGVACEPAVGVTDSRVAASCSEKTELADSGADVVDMESHPILQAARAAGVDCVVLRAVSDSAAMSLPDFTAAFAPDGRLRRAAAARIALGSPIRTAQLVRASRRAMDKLASALEVFFSSGGLTGEPRDP